ncbi:MAG: hypothetical protein AAGA96_19760 [Verrucomicrobiota bacterium]
MKSLFSVSAPQFRTWKIWNPLLEVLFFAGVGVYWWFQCSGVLLILDVFAAALLGAAISSAVWRGIILKDVRLDGDYLHVSDLRGEWEIPISSVSKVIDRSKMKAWVPSSILLNSRDHGFRRIRFIPAAPRSETVAKLIAYIDAQEPEPRRRG